jgi:hypothetical protein
MTGRILPDSRFAPSARERYLAGSA